MPTCVYIGLLFPAYYTKPSINWLFEPLNEFKWKSCQLQSLLLFEIYNFHFGSFIIRGRLQKFEFQIWEIQI
jgi:hypothetical protein